MPIPGNHPGALDEIALLAGLLAQPGADSLEALHDLLPRAPWLQGAVAELAALPLAQWQGEHTRLFLNGVPRTPCPPFASAWRKGTMGGDIATAARLLFRQAGLEPRGELPPDYLGTLLEGAALLASRGDAPSGALLERLWQEQILPWVPDWAQALEQASGLLLYRVLARRLAILLGDGAS
ncbi:MAG: molecular chaperone TorD family protein [Magnetococcales bacterium]|nr:molecular chaperone TorD family protein [Magnetococcales bacterium]